MRVFLTWAVNVILIGFLGPVFKLEGCGFDSSIIEKQSCVEETISRYIVPFGALSYCCALITYFSYWTNEQFSVVMGSASATVISTSCYAYFLSTQVLVTSWSIGYYAVYIGIVMFVFFMVVYKLKIKMIP